MCGFVVIYSDRVIDFDPNLLEVMTNTMQHRGPDDYGFSFVGPNFEHIWQKHSPPLITSKGVAMGHRRLSILDLSSAGRQPFVSRDKRFWTVYNGEIFNYLELREDLSKLGYSFRTATDTEVVLTAYEEWGSEFLNYLNGMWAFVIWDNKDKTLLASRDRFGIKPLYYYRSPGQWIFASEVKALLRHPLISKKPNKKAIFHFLAAELPPEEEGTYFQDIKSLEPATYLFLKNDQVEQKKFWQLPDYVGYISDNTQNLSVRFLEILKDAVRLRLRSDVKVGTMFSGGLDSTTIVKLIHELLSENVEDAVSVGSTQQTFTASFPDTDLDETNRVGDLKNQLNLNVTKIFPAKVDVSRIFQEVVYHMEMPFAKSTPIVQYLLMHRASCEGVKVVLNGHGSDEMLGGYSERYCPLVSAQAFLDLRFIEGVKQLRKTKQLYNIGLDETVYSLLCIAMPKVAEAIKGLFRYRKKNFFNKEFFRHYPFIFPFLRDKRTIGSSSLDRRLRQEFFYELLPVWLKMEDKISMSASVESRLPFIDYRLVEFSFGLGDTEKIRNGVTKYILRNAMRNNLPNSIICENKKYTFSGPLAFWLKNSLKPMLVAFFIENSPMISEFINTKKVRRLILRFLNDAKCDRLDEYFIWRSLNAEVLLRTFFS